MKVGGLYASGLCAGLLGSSCPTSASGPVALSASRCVRSAFWGHPCTACAAACPVQAVALEGSGPRLDLSACVGCGACVAACPAGAWTDRFQTEDDLVRLGARDDGAVPLLKLTCRRSESQPKDCRVLPCLGRLTPAAILSMLAAGTRRVELHRPECGACVWAKAGRVLDKTVTATRALAAACGYPADAFEVHPCGPVGPVRPSSPVAHGGRREFLAGVFRIAAGAAASASLPTLPAFPADPGQGARDLLLEVLRGKAPLVPCEAKAGQVPFARLEVRSTCDACGACARVCATRALVVERREDNARIVFSPAACTGCGACAVVCWPRALKLADTVDPAWVFEESVRVLHRVQGSECLVCGALVAEGEVCRLCSRG